MSGPCFDILYNICYNLFSLNVIGDVVEELVKYIRNSLGMSQQEFASKLGVTFATINRWENGHSTPNMLAETKLYEFCKENRIDLGAFIDSKIKAFECDLYHGSKAGLDGKIAPSSRAHCDFGKGFYMGNDYMQSLTLVCAFPKSKLYAIDMDMSGLKVLHVKPDIEWAMLVAFHRGKMDSVKGSALYEKYAAMLDGYDVVVGSIADDRMFYVIDNFFTGAITDKALVASLAALQLGEQYVAISEKACRAVKVKAEIPLSHTERLYLQATAQRNRINGINLANDVCKKYRREGLYFDEILGG